MKPIVSSIGSITYECTRYLANILSPLSGKTRHHIRNSAEFNNVNLKVKPDEELRSYDVSALFTSVSVDKVLVKIHRKLHDDTTLSERTSLTLHDIVGLLELCLKCTYLCFSIPVLSANT